MLKVNQQLMDLGEMKYGNVYKFEYTITNPTPKDMPINKLQVSCSSCTQAVFTKEVKAYTDATLKVTFTPGVVGLTSKYIDIIYDKDQRLRVEFKGVVNG